MNDEESRRLKNQLELERRLAQITPELFADFFIEKGIPNPKCIYCGSEDVGSPQTQTIQAGMGESSSTWQMAYVKVDAPGPPFSFINYEYRIICRNCGYTSYFSVWPVLKWVEEKLK